MRQDFILTSYYTEIKNKNLKYGITDHGAHFKSIYENKNIFGCQPHPEKSQKFGLQIIKNFCELCQQKEQQQF